MVEHGYEADNKTRAAESQEQNTDAPQVQSTVGRRTDFAEATLRVI